MRSAVYLYIYARMSSAHSPTFPSLHLRHSSFPTLPSLYLRHSSFSNPSIASPTSQFILQPFFRFSYVTSSSLNSPGEPPMCFIIKCMSSYDFFLRMTQVVDILAILITLLIQNFRESCCELLGHLISNGNTCKSQILVVTIEGFISKVTFLHEIKFFTKQKF